MEKKYWKKEVGSSLLVFFAFHKIYPTILINNPIRIIDIAVFDDIRGENFYKKIQVLLETMFMKIEK